MNNARLRLRSMWRVFKGCVWQCSGRLYTFLLKHLMWHIYVCFNGMKPDDEFKKHEIFLLSPRSHWDSLECKLRLAQDFWKDLNSLKLWSDQYELIINISHRFLSWSNDLSCSHSFIDVHLNYPKFCINSNIVKYYYSLKYIFSIWIYIKM